MKLSDLLKSISLNCTSSEKDLIIRGISEDSRTVQKGFLFLARKGSKDSALNHIRTAIEKGAIAVLSEEPIPNLAVPNFSVPSILQVEPKIANCFYDFPSQSLTLVGVTGTNGKTTFTYLLESIAKEMGWRVGVLGTINYRLPTNGMETELFPAPNTTPNALELQRLISIMKQRECTLALLEVSSHALALSRVEGIDFDGAVFTNLTQDHLDFHQSLEEYFRAKLKLFTERNPQKKKIKSAPDKFAILNWDDPYGRRIAPISSTPVTGYGLKTMTDYTVETFQILPNGSRFKIKSKEGSHEFRTQLLGEYNIYNTVAAIATARALGIPYPIIEKGLSHLPLVPGRLEPIQCGQDFTVLVDYAHTEDALQNVLRCLQSLSPKRILTLFGCGGDRDRGKRPKMGAAAAQGSDWVWITSDNPRSEDPLKIVSEIEEGIRKIGKTNYTIVLDREEAIRKCLSEARSGDLILLAGKGHETVQILQNHMIPFDDRDIVRKYFKVCSH